jgi:hypothetical protein
LLLCIDRLKAQETIAERGYALPAEELRRQVYIATGSAEKAEEAWLAKAERDLASGK